MKNTLLILIALALSACTGVPNKKNIEPKQDTITYYGKQISQELIDDYPKLKELVKKNGKENSRLSGKIIETCQKKGCWMSFDTGTDTLFIKFRNYSFFVPINGVNGKDAIVEGDLFLDTISVKMLKHYAEDAGKSADEIALITEPSFDVNFIADGVIIKD